MNPRPSDRFDEAAPQQTRTVRAALVIRRPAVIAGVLLCAAAAVHLWLAVAEQGIVWPDEIYQSLEQAHRLVYGYGFVPWEFDQGARSWIFPACLGGLLEVVSWLGLDGVRGPVLAARLSMALVSVLDIWLVMRLAGRVGGGPTASLAAGILAASFPISLLFGTRCMPEVASGPLVLGAALLALGGSDPSVNRARIGGALMALACFFRYQNGLIAAVFLGALLWRRQWRQAAGFGQGAAALSLLGGMLDLLTWGRPFQSLRVYLSFNLFHSGSSFGVQPIWFYARSLWTSSGASLIVVLGGLLLTVRSRPWIFATVAVYLVAHSLVPHKELRFILPVVPLLLAGAGVGLGRLVCAIPWGGTGRALLAAALLMTAAAAGRKTARLSRADIGYFAGEGAGAWHNRESYNRLLWHLGSRADVCGVALTGANLIRVGGYSYLRHDVPFLNEWLFRLPSGSAAVNYVLAPIGRSAPLTFTEVARHGEIRLLRRNGRCGPAPPGFAPHFPSPRRGETEAQPADPRSS
jgi:GPI mannosyltransferase 3